MEVPLQVTVRGFPHSPALEARIQERARELEEFADRIISCHVVVERDHRRQHQGNLYHVRIDVSVPGSVLVVNREPPRHQAHQDPYVAVRDAFDAARRQLEDWVRRQRGDTKLHESQSRGRVVRLLREEGYGFLHSRDTGEVYFHRNSVTDGNFDRLEVGSDVHFVVGEDGGSKGPHASTVTLRHPQGP